MILQPPKGLPSLSDTTFVLFNEHSRVRRERYHDERYYSIVDIVAILTESIDPQTYRRVLKKRLIDEGNETVTNCNGLKMRAQDGKMRVTDVGNTEEILRLIQSIPSPRAEPFKSRLSSLWNERFQEMNDPELWLIRARERAIDSYRAKGWTDNQIRTRLQSIDTRHRYTDELKNRGIKNGLEYAILTDKGYSRTGMNTRQYKEFKWLNKHDNLRDNMSEMELLLTGIQEATSKEIIVNRDAQWFNQISECVDESVEATKEAKEALEKRLGSNVAKSGNNLTRKQTNTLKTNNSEV